MAIREEIKLRWVGVDYPLVVTMDLIAHIENYINLTSFVSDVARNEVKASQAAIYASKLLKAAGVEVDIDDCYTAYVGAESKARRDEVAHVIAAGLNAMFPIGKKKTPVKKVARKKAPKKATVKAT